MNEETTRAAKSAKYSTRNHFGHTFSILYFSSACVAQSTASCCISSLMSAFLMTALRSDILAANVWFSLFFLFTQEKWIATTISLVKHYATNLYNKWCNANIREGLIFRFYFDYNTFSSSYYWFEWFSTNFSYQFTWVNNLIFLHFSTICQCEL